MVLLQGKVSHKKFKENKKNGFQRSYPRAGYRIFSTSKAFLKNVGEVSVTLSGIRIYTLLLKSHDPFHYILKLPLAYATKNYRNKDYYFHSSDMNYNTIWFYVSFAEIDIFIHYHKSMN